MATRNNQVTANLRISADMHLKNSKNFINQLEKVTKDYNFGEKINKQLEDAKKQLKDYNKILEKVEKRSIISNDELKQLVKAGKEIANIITKTESLYLNLNDKGLEKYSKENIKRAEEQEAAIAKIKEDYAKKTGKNFDKDLANYDKIKNKIKELEKEKEKLERDGSSDIATRQVEQLNKKLEEQKNKLIEIQKLQQKSSSAYSSTLESESKKRGYKNYEELKNIKVLNENQVRKQLGNEEYKKQLDLISSATRETKQLEQSKKSGKILDKEALKLAKKYNLENVSNLETLKEQLKFKKSILNTYKENKSALVDEKLITAEMRKQEQIARDKAQIESIAKENELKVIQSGGYTSRASLTATSTATNKSINNLTSQLTEDGIDNIITNATNVVAKKVENLENEIRRSNEELTSIDETNKKLATQSERAADEQDINALKQRFNNSLQDTESDVNQFTNKDNTRIADKIITLGVGNKVPYGKEITAAIKNLMGDLSKEDQEEAFFYSQDFNSLNSKLENEITALKLGKGSVNEILTLTEEIEKTFARINQFVQNDIATRQDEIDKSNLDKKQKDEADSLLAMELNQWRDIEKGVYNTTYAMRTVVDETSKIENNLLPIPKNLNSISNAAQRGAFSLQRAAEESQYLGSAFDDIKNKVGYFLSLNYVFDQVTRKITQAVQTTKDIDRDMTQIGLVLEKTSGQVWKNFNTYYEMANRLDTTTSQVTNSMKLFYQQGLNTSQVNKMVEASAIAAALGESTMAEASETLTSIVNSYNLSANEAITVTDKISQIAIVSAADFGELSTAIEKVASSAASAGLDLDHLMGYLGKMIETTREAPTNIGTALKTIVANFTQFKEDPTGLAEEGTEINKVDKALKSVGINLTNANGDVRDLSEVIDDLGQKWDSLNRSQRAYMATAIAGTRQQSRFYALMNDYGRTMELVAEGSNSAGKAQQQFELYGKSLAASTERLNNEWERFFNQITSGNGLIRNITDGLTSLMKIVNEIGPIGTVLGLTSLISQIRKGITQIDNFNLSVEKLQTGEINASKIKRPLAKYRGSKKRKASKEIIQENGVNLLNIAEQEGLGGVKLKDIQKAIKIADLKKEIINLNKEIAVTQTLGEKVSKRWQKTTKTVKMGFLQAGIAVKSFAKSLATASVQMAAMYLAGKLLEGIGDIINSLTTSAEKFSETAEKASEQADTIKGLRDEYEELVNTVDRTADQERRLKEITAEVTEISTDLNGVLIDNVEAFENNIKVMDAYIARQEKIAGTNTINAALSAAKEQNGWWDNVTRWINTAFGDGRQEETSIEAAKTLYGNIDSGAAQQSNLDSERKSILNTYAEQLMTQLESGDRTADEWYDGLEQYKDKVVSMAKNLSKLDSVVLKNYSDLQTAFANKDLTYGILKEQLKNANIDSTIKEGYYQAIRTAQEGIASTISANTSLDNNTISYLNDNLSREALTNIFNPKNFDTLNDKEQQQYWNSITDLFNDKKLRQGIIEAVNKNGIDGLQKFIKNLDSSSIEAKEIVQDTLAGLINLSNVVETASEAFKELSDLLSSKVFTGEISQLDIISGLVDNTFNIQDIRTIGNSNMLSINFDTILNQISQKFEKLKAPFEKQIENLEEQIKYYNDYGNNLIKDAEEKLKLQQAAVEKAEEDYRQAKTKAENTRIKYETQQKDLEQRRKNAYDSPTTKAIAAIPVVGLLGAIVGIELGAKSEERELMTQKENDMSLVSAEENATLQALNEQKAKYNEINEQLQRTKETKELIAMTDEQITLKAKEQVNTSIKQSKEAEKWVSILNDSGQEVGKVNSDGFTHRQFIDKDKNKGMAESKARELIKEGQEDNIKLYETEEKALKEIRDNAKQYAKDQVDANKEIKESYEKTLSAIEKIEQQSLQYQKTFKSVFESFSNAGQIYGQLEGLADAYSLCNKGANGYFEVSKMIAEDPSLINALDLESKYLELDKQKVIELGKEKVQHQINDLKTRLEGTKAIISLIEAQQKAGDAQVVAEANNLDDKASIIASAAAYNEDYTKSTKETTETEGENLEISVDNWTNWQEAIITIMQRIESERAKLAQRIASGETVVGSIKEATLRSTKINYTASTGKDADEIEKTEKEKYNSILDEINKASSKELSEMLDSYTKQKKILEKSIASLEVYKKNMASNLNEIAGNSNSGDSFEPVIEKLEKFYNYLRQLEEIEADLNRLREKRNLIDATKNYYIDDLQKENDLLKEQQSIYNDYIRDQGPYLQELQKQIQSIFGDWAYFNDEGVIQVKQTEFTANSEEEEERLNNFLELVELYQEEYNTREENINKLYEIENTQLENIATMYEKILTRVQDVTDALNRQKDLLDHDMTMSFSNISKFNLMDDQMTVAAKGIKETYGYLNQFAEEMENLNKQISDGPFNELLLWDETLEHWRVNEEKLQDDSIVAKYENMGYVWQDIDTYIRSVATESQAVRDAWKETEDSANSFAELLKQLVNDRIDLIQDYYGAATEEVNKIFNSFDSKMTDADNRNNLFGVVSENLEDKYLTLVTAVSILKQTIQQLRDNRDGILDRIQKEYSEYIDIINGVAIVNKQRVEESSKLTESEKVQLLQLYGVLEASEEQIDEMEDKLVDYFNTMLEMEQEKRDAIIDLKQQVHDELIARDQEEIDDLRAKYDKMSQLDSEYYSELSQRVNDERNLRQDRQESSNIAQTQARLAVLKADNSGTYNAELIELQKQLNTQLQSQADNEVNRELERIQREQQEREEDRQLTISAMENVLTFKDENSWYWQEAQKIWNEGPESVTGFLRSSREYMNISDEQRAVEFENLTNNMNTAFSTLQTEAGLSDRISDGIVSDKSDEEQMKLDTVNNNLKFISEALGESGLAGKISWANEESMKKIGELGNTVDNSAIKIADKMQSLYNTDIEPGVTGIKDAIKGYLDKDSEIWKKLDEMAKGQLTYEEFNDIVEDASGAADRIVKGIEDATTEYLSVDNKLYHWLQEQYAKENAEEVAKDQIANITTPSSNGNSNAGNTNSNSSSENNNKNNNATKKPELKIGSTVSVKPGTKWYYDSYGKAPTGIARGGVIKYTNLSGSHPYNIEGLGWIRKQDIVGYSKGGYVDYTGIANVHGSQNSPEAFLNARQTRLFEVLRDSLTKAASNKMLDKNSEEITKEEYNIDNINIEVKEIADTDSIDKVVQKVKTQIYNDSIGRNNMAIRRR